MMKKFMDLFGLHTSFTLQQMTLEAVKEAMKDLDTGIHVHCAEDLTDQEITQKLSAFRVVERYQKLGLLGPKSICAHAVHVDDRELKILKETETIVVHNPQSNMNNAVGVANTLDFAKNEIKFCLGIDSMTHNMLEEARTALWVQKLRAKNPSVAFNETVDSLIINNPIMANRFFGNGKLGLGELKEGNAADIILMDYCPYTPFDVSNFYGHLIFGLSQSTVESTIVDGKVLMKNRQLTFLNEEEIITKARELSQKLWERF